MNRSLPTPRRISSSGRVRRPPPLSAFRLWPVTKDLRISPEMSEALR
jgi:hypothetical protein